MWTVVYIAPNHPIADMLQGILEEEGILVMKRPIGAPHLGASSSVELLVPESEAEEAHDILTNSFGR